MADRDPEEQPSLELPSLGGLRRRRRSRRRKAEPAAPVAEPAPTPTPEPEAQPEPEPEPEPEPVAAAPSSGEQTTAVLPEAPQAVEPEAPRRRRRRPVRERGPGGLPTVLVVGLLVGLAVVGLTWASLQTCEQVQGTPSCGRAGYPMLALVLVLSVVVGAVLLRLARVADPASISFLGTGLAAVVALLVLVDQLDRPAMVVVIPVISALTFAAAHWVTTTFIEPGGRD